MEKEEKDEQEVQETPEAEPEKEPQLTKEEIADLRKRADASSQNYERLKKEEEKRKQLEKEKKELEKKLKASESDPYSDDDDELKGQIADLSATIFKMKEESDFKEVLSAHPVIGEKREEFDEFREGYPSLSIEKVAKLFIFEKGLTDETTKRKGLEKGGQKRTTQQRDGMTSEEVKSLRENNYKKYRELVKTGKLKIVDDA